MRLGTNRDDGEGAPDPADPAAYWRRRFLILGGGLAVLAVLAWQFTGARPSAGTPADAGTPAADTLPSAAYGSAYPGPRPTPSVAATLTATAAARPTPGPAISTAGAGKTPRPRASGAVAAGRCAPADIVLSLFTSQASYRQGTPPQFNVYAVSTAAGTCRMAFGPGSVRVIVTRHGQVVWDSAACRPAPAATVPFALGVPQLLTISWNRAAAHPAGCAGSLPAGASGTFQAVAMSAGQSSAVRTFTLLRG